MSLKKHIVVALTAIFLLTGGAVASAQTSTTTPGVPNTGAAGDAVTNWLVLGATGLAVLAGIGYLARKPRESSN